MADEQLTGAELLALCNEDLEARCECGHTGVEHYDAPYGSGPCRNALCSCRWFRRPKSLMRRFMDWVTGGISCLTP